MSTHRAITVLGLLIASCTGLVACGGSSGQLSKSETITQAGAICDRASKQARQYAVGRTLPNSPVEFNSAIEEDTRIARQTESALGQLNPVSDGRESLDRFVAAQAAIVRANVAQLAAFKSLDQSKIQASIDDLLSATGDAKKAAHEYGLDGCPYIPVSIQLSRQSAKNSSQAGLASPGDAVGHWTGPVTQYGPGTNTLRYVVKMNVDVIGRTPGKIVGTTLYPSLHCGGRLRLTGAEGIRYVYRERITFGPKSCGSGGTIFATVSGNSMSWHWVARGIEVAGTLRLTGLPPQKPGY